MSYITHNWSFPSNELVHLGDSSVPLGGSRANSRNKTAANCALIPNVRVRRIIAAFATISNKRKRPGVGEKMGSRAAEKEAKLKVVGDVCASGSY